MNITNDTIENFKNFLEKLIITLQIDVNSGELFWKTDLTNFSKPCLIEIFSSDKNALMLVFPEFLKINEDLVIRIHKQSKNANLLDLIQKWVEDPIWDEIPYPFNDVTHPSPIFKHALAGLSEILYNVLQNTDSMKAPNVLAKRILKGSLIYLNNIPDLDSSKWSKQLTSTQETQKTKMGRALNYQFHDKKEIYAEISVMSPNASERYGCYFYPPIWLGMDFWLDAKSYTEFSLFRDYLNVSTTYIGRTMFGNKTISFDRFGLLMIRDQIQKNEAIKVLNQLIFSLTILIDPLDLSPISREKIYPIDKVDLCQGLMDDTTGEFQHSMVIGNQGERAYWSKKWDEKPKKNHFLDEEILILQPSNFIDIILKASEKFTKLVSDYNLKDVTFELLLQSLYHNYHKNFLISFSLGFFALESIINDIWERKIINKYEQIISSNQRVQKEIGSSDWTLSLRTQTLILEGILTKKEKYLIDFWRKKRNSIVHGSISDLEDLNKRRVFSLLDFSKILLHRVNHTGEISQRPEDENIIDTIAKEWNYNF